MENMNHNPTEWEEEFDKEFDPEKHWQGDEWVTEKLKSFIRSLLAKQARDHEILVNTILETKDSQLLAQEKKLRKEWEENKYDLPMDPIGDPVAQWWLKKIAQARQEHNEDCTREEWVRHKQREELRESVEGMRKGRPLIQGGVSPMMIWYNAALSDVLALLDKKEV